MTTNHWIMNISMIIIALVFIQMWKKNIYDKLSISFQKNKLDIYFQTLDSWPCKCLFPLFNRLYMQLNGYMAIKNNEKVNETTDVLLNLHLPKNQAVEAYIKCFYYYIIEEDIGYSGKVLKKINDIGEENISMQCNQLYDIFIKKESKYIQSMEEQLNQCKDDYSRQMLLYLIGIQNGYNNIQKKEEHLTFVSKEKL